MEGNMDNGKTKDFLVFQLRRKIVNLYKNYLFILEDMKDAGYDIPEEEYQRIRKRILDYGNDTIREIEENLENFDIKLKL
jgi:isoleucyl-tRNA synthetase